LGPRHIAAVASVLGLTVAGFIAAHVLAERDARHESERRVEIAAALIRSRVEVATSLTESLRRFMSDEGATGVTNDQFTKNALRWLSPADLPAAAWAEEVRAADRAAYERRTGRPIVKPDERRKAVPPGSSYLPATLVSGFRPTDSRGIDLRRELGVAAALASAIRPGGVGATPVAARRDGSRGLFLVAPAPNVIEGVLRPGAVVVFLSETTLRAAARNPMGLRFIPSSGDVAGGDAVREEFTVAGRQFAVALPEEPVSGPGAALPWIILAGGLLLAALAGALGVIAARRARAKRDLDRIFNLSADLVAVANFDGYFTRVNPAAERILGYTEKELLARPYLDFVHSDDREKTAAETAAIGDGDTTLGFQNRFARKDGSYRVLEWAATPVPEEQLMYSVGRDVTERREAEAEVERLADEQAALRRVATLVAHEAPPTEVFAKVADEVATVLGDVDCALWRDEGDGTASAVAVRGASVAAGIRAGARLPLDGESLTAVVLRDGRSSRIEDYSVATGTMAERARELGIRAATACPIVVSGRTWGAMAVATFEPGPFPPGTETRLEQFSELVATAIANGEARAEVERLAQEQAALRRLATLVAEGAPSAEIFLSVSNEVGHVLGVELVAVAKFEHDPPANVVVGVGKDVPGIALGSRWEHDDSMASARVYQTGRSARVDAVDWSAVDAPIAEHARHLGVVSSISSPIVVEGRLWGAVDVTANEPLPPHSEERLEHFTDVIATAIANAESREALRQLAAEQAALRRVATLVAEETSPADVFATVVEELANVLGAVECMLFRDEADGTATAVALWGARVSAGVPVGTRLPTDGDGVIASVLRDRRPHRIGDYSAASGAIAERGYALGIRSSVGCPIVTGGRVWGAIGAARYEAGAFPPETETRMSQFADLVATAIANAETRSEVDRLAAEQAALRRVATLVAQGSSPATVFEAVAAEMEGLLAADGVTISRYEPGGEVTVLAHHGSNASRVPPGTRVRPEADSVTATVRRTKQPARMEHYKETPDPIAQLVRILGVGAAVGAPIVVEGRLWGVVIANWQREESPPADTEERMAQFAELLDTGIANADSRDQLTASRARLLTEADEARRRVVRDLHDGAQQRLVHTVVTLKLAQRALRGEAEAAESLVGEALERAEQANAELRELAHGILPAVLTRGGLRAGVDAVAARLDLLVTVDVPAERFPQEIEASAYFIVAEALTNVVKHAHAESAEVRVFARNEMLRVEVRDDGLGGADPNGHGLVGMGDRVTALGGGLEIQNAAGGGTLVVATLPLA
jgi:PAS domain S-box-containing protein